MGHRQQEGVGSRAALFRLISYCNPRICKGKGHWSSDVRTHPTLLVSSPVHLGHGARVQGRATVEMQIKLKEARMEGVTGGQLKIVVDGYNAPVTGGNFVDLVQRGFYNNMEIQRADGFVVQTGDPGPPVRLAASDSVISAPTWECIWFPGQSLAACPGLSDGGVDLCCLHHAYAFCRCPSWLCSAMLCLCMLDHRI